MAPCKGPIPAQVGRVPFSIQPVASGVIRNPPANGNALTAVLSRKPPSGRQRCHRETPRPSHSEASLQFNGLPAKTAFGSKDHRAAAKYLAERDILPVAIMENFQGVGDGAVSVPPIMAWIPSVG